MSGLRRGVGCEGSRGRGERIVGHVREGGGLCRRARLDDLDGFDEDDVTIFRLSNGSIRLFLT